MKKWRSMEVVMAASSQRLSQGGICMGEGGRRSNECRAAEVGRRLLESMSH
jgi:hypothetical protein